MNNADMPAMPLADPEIWLDPTKPEKGVVSAYGLTKREYFAAMAMQGLLAGSRGEYVPPDVAVEHADAVLAELAKE